MEAGADRPPIWLLPQSLVNLPAGGGGRPRLAFGVAVLGLAALAPAYAVLAPAARWDEPALLVLLMAFSFYAYVGAARIRDTVTLDADFVAALLAVVFLGPLPAALVYAAPELTRLVSDRRPISIMGNLASFGWASLAAAGTLAVLGVSVPATLGTAGSYAAVALAGLVLIAVNYFYITVISAVIRDGMDLWMVTRRELLATLPAAIVLIWAATGVAFLYEEIGLAGLIPLVGVVFLPRLLMPALLRDIPVSELEPADATARYAEGIADVLALTSAQRRVLRDASTHLGGHARLGRLDDFVPVMQAVLYAREHWDGGGGFPGALTGPDIPIESRVLAVAHAWSGLTAKGSAGLSPDAALVHLRARAGAELDPEIVSAAMRAVEEEIVPLPARRTPFAAPAQAPPDTRLAT